MGKWERHFFHIDEVPRAGRDELTVSIRILVLMEFTECFEMPPMSRPCLCNTPKFGYLECPVETGPSLDSMARSLVFSDRRLYSRRSHTLAQCPEDAKPVLLVKKLAAPWPPRRGRRKTVRSVRLFSGLTPKVNTNARSEFSSVGCSGKLHMISPDKPKTLLSFQGLSFDSCDEVMCCCQILQAKIPSPSTVQLRPIR